MIKKYVFLLFLSTIYLTTCNKTEVIYDKLRDIIYYEGKLYISKSFNQSQTKPEEISSKIDPFKKNEDLITVLTLGAGLMSGLTVGYLSIDDLVLELRSNNGTDEEKEHAEKVLPILLKRHWLMVTLLLINALFMEALPLFLNKIVPEFFAVLISVTLVLLFGEIIPQAYCTGPDQIKIAAMIAPVTKFLMFITYPISYPISILLDFLLGEHHKSRFINNDLKALIELHTYNALEKLELSKDSKQDESDYKIGLNDEQANLMISALEMREKKVIELMIPINKTFMIDYDEALEKFKLNLILDKGYSRIPVYSNHNTNDIVGLLRIKQLIGVDFNQNKSLRQLGIELRKPIVISPKYNIIDLLREFRKGKSHMAFITEQVEDLQNKLGLNRSNSIKIDFCDDMGNWRNTKSKNIKILGIITLEDVIEKMINLEILDEDDYEKLLRRKKVLNKNISNKNLMSVNKSKEIVSSFIKEESSKLESIIKSNNASYKKSVKEFFLKRKNNDSAEGSFNNNQLKDSLV